ncbi:hypothetical protein ACWED2_26505 [Amycolatopsis sp. NPDC005003]
MSTFVAHEPPLLGSVPDAAAAERASQAMREAYQAKGFGAGLPIEDDGRRGDPLLSDRSLGVTTYRLDIEALMAAPTRIVVAVGEESREVFAGRAAIGTAALCGQEATVFPSRHGGFLDGEFGYAGQPDAFAKKLRKVVEG